tara:strand:- start:26 stop:367 length:342 start_codon:yes stop_codon:yes gene_type:complete
MATFQEKLRDISLPTVAVTVTQDTEQTDIKCTPATIDSGPIAQDPDDFWAEVSQNTTWFSFKVADLERAFKKGDKIDYNNLTYLVTGNPKTGEVNNYTTASRTRVKVYAIEID